MSRLSKYPIIKIEGGKHFLVLPENLPNFEEVNLKMKKILGRYKRFKKDKGFEFDFNPTPFLAAIDKGETPNIRQDNQFFETPEEVWYQIFDEISGCFTPNCRILEPSAGRGGMLNGLAWWCMSSEKVNPFDFLNYKIHLIEKNEINRSLLSEKMEKLKKTKVFKHRQLLPIDDFLLLDERNKYDIILANPPFNKGQAEAHFKKMLLHLAPDGVCACIVPSGFNHADFTSGFLVKEIAFAKGAFKNSGTNVGTKCIIVSKREQLKTEQRIVVRLSLRKPDEPQKERYDPFEDTAENNAPHVFYETPAKQEPQQVAVADAPKIKKAKPKIIQQQVAVADAPKIKKAKPKIIQQQQLCLF